jgi:hypothetical protein
MQFQTELRQTLSKLFEKTLGFQKWLKAGVSEDGQ